MAMGSRGGFRRKRKSPLKKKGSCCDSIREVSLSNSAQWIITALERLKEEWKEDRNLSSRCYPFQINDEQRKNWERKFLRCDILVEFADCGERTQIILVKKGKDAERERERRERENRRKDREKRMGKLKADILNDREEWEKKSLSSHNLELEPEELQKQEKPEEVETPMGTVCQIYILELKDQNSFYVGGTKKGYPMRAYHHTIGYRNKLGILTSRPYKEDQLKFDDSWRKNLQSEIMKIAQPIDKKLECYHAFEGWLQGLVLKNGFKLLGGEKWWKDFGGTTCETCRRIADDYGLPWPTQE